MEKDRFSASLLFSSFAALASRLITHPIDTVKTIAQSKSLSSQPLRIEQISKVLYRTGGLSSFYKGLSVSLLFSVPGMSLYLTTYDQLKNSISNSQFANLFLTSGGSRRSEDNMIVHALAGASAEIVSGLFWTPMEVIKNKLQISGNLTSLGIVESRREKINARNLAIDIYKKEGLHGFFRGYWLGLAVFIPYTVVYFTTYEQLKFQSQRYINKRSKLNYQIPLPFYVYVSCSACSGMVAGAISNAFDVVKTRRQTSLSIEKKTKTIVAEIWNQSGWKGFTKGLTARVLWVIPSVTISITVYETLKDSFWV